MPADAMVSAKVANTEPKSSLHRKSNNVIVKKVIKNGDLDIQVGDIKKAHQQVNKIIKSNNAYIYKQSVLILLILMKNSFSPYVFRIKILML
ncbi:hypothetical protein [Chryseobacterium indoltheticum]|uniref:hypothetical protein n=1 Tax=Chryseobacterium indoltheticum TaxID=254 RepID=UPI003F496A49